MLHTKIPANCIDRIFQCPQSVDFGTGPIKAPGAFRPNSLNSTPSSLRGKIVDELAKCKFAKARFLETDKERFEEIYNNNIVFKTPVTVNGKEYWWGNKDSEYQLLGDKASAFMLKKLEKCQDVFCDRFDSLLRLFKNFPDVKFYTNENEQEVAYNAKTYTEFAFGASVDFGGVDNDTTYLIELKTGSPDAYKNCETQLKVSALACILNYKNVNTVICGCYNVDSNDYKEWIYTRDDLKKFIPVIRDLLFKIYTDEQPEYLTAVTESKWCDHCDCRRCPYSRMNKNDQQFQEIWSEVIKEEAELFNDF